MRIVKIIAVALACILVVCFAVELEHGVSTPSQPVSEPAPQPTKEQLAKAQRCRTAIKADPNIRRYEWQGPYLTAEIGPAFFSSDYEMKDALTRLLLCVGTDGRMDGSITSVDYLDWRTHQSVARWSIHTGLKINSQ